MQTARRKGKMLKFCELIKKSTVSQEYLKNLAADSINVNSREKLIKFRCRIAVEPVKMYLPCSYYSAFPNIGKVFLV
jgi:hypothetical protein